MRGHHHLPISGRLIGQLATGSETPLDQFHKTIENNRSETVSWHNTSDAQVPPADLPAAFCSPLCAGVLGWPWPPIGRLSSIGPPLV